MPFTTLGLSEPILRVLDSLCYNEMMRAEGFKSNDPKIVKVEWWQAIVAHLFDFYPSLIKPIGATE